MTCTACRYRNRHQQAAVTAHSIWSGCGQIPARILAPGLRLRTPAIPFLKHCWPVCDRRVWTRAAWTSTGATTR